MAAVVTVAAAQFMNHIQEMKTQTIVPLHLPTPPQLAMMKKTCRRQLITFQQNQFGCHRWAQVRPGSVYLEKENNVTQLSFWFSFFWFIGFIFFFFHVFMVACNHSPHHHFRFVWWWFCFSPLPLQLAHVPLAPYVDLCYFGNLKKMLGKNLNVSVEGIFIHVPSWFTIVYSVQFFDLVNYKPV